MTNSWAIHDNYMFKKKDIFCFNTNYHELTINYSLIKIVRVMTKKDYMKPVIEFGELDMSEQLLVMSVTTTGLGDGEELRQDETSGDSWTDALSRRGAWDEE